MNKIKILIIALLTILVSNNVSAQKAQPLVPHWTYFTFEKTIMEEGVDLNTATLTLHLVGNKDFVLEDGGFVDMWKTMPATTSNWSPGFLMSNGSIEVWINGIHAWAHEPRLYFIFSPLNVSVPINVYRHYPQNPH